MDYMQVAFTVVFATVAAHFDTTQPDQTQLGIQAVSTASVATVKGQGSVLSNQLTALANTPVKQLNAFVNVPAVQPATGPPGQALGPDWVGCCCQVSASGSNAQTSFRLFPVASAPPKMYILLLKATAE